MCATPRDNGVGGIREKKKNPVLFGPDHMATVFFPSMTLQKKRQDLHTAFGVGMHIVHSDKKEK